MKEKFAAYHLELKEVLIGTPASAPNDRTLEQILRKGRRARPATPRWTPGGASSATRRWAVRRAPERGVAAGPRGARPGAGYSDSPPSTSTTRPVK